MSVPIPSKITAEVLDLENLFSLIRILGDDASGGDVHGGGLAVVEERCHRWGNTSQLLAGPRKIDRTKLAAPI